MPSGRMEKGAIDALLRLRKRSSRCSCRWNRPSAATTLNRAASWSNGTLADLNRSSRQGGGPSTPKPANEPCFVRRVTQDEQSPRWIANAGIPVPRLVQKRNGEACCIFEAELHNRVIGQQQASRRWQDAIQRSAPVNQIRMADRFGSCFWTQGVGKTELAKPLPQCSTATTPWCASTMSEYMEKHAVKPPDRRPSRLCGLRRGCQLNRKPCAARHYAVILR